MMRRVLLMSSYCLLLYILNEILGLNVNIIKWFESFGAVKITTKPKLILMKAS